MKLIIVSKNGCRDDTKEEFDYNWDKHFPHCELLELLARKPEVASEYETVDRIREAKNEIEESVQEIVNIIGAEACWKNKKIYRAIMLLRKLEC